VTECDRLAAHPDDPNHVLPGLERVQMDMPKAIAACRRDLAKDPDNPRLRYQLARALTYSGNVAEALPLIERTVEQNYPQSLFVTGYLYLTGAYDAPKDPCRAGELIRASALAGRLAGQVGFPKYYLDGRFKGCPVKQDRAEMVAFLEAAVKSKPDYYPLLLADELLRTFRALPPGVMP
jgi:tetratricopeptide (TPR) repeat protein